MEAGSAKGPGPRYVGEPDKGSQAAWIALPRPEAQCCEDLVRHGVRKGVRISGHKTRSAFDRDNLVNELDLTDASDPRRTRG